MTKNCFSKLMISYMYIFSQQLYSHACIPSADGPIITLFVVGCFGVGFFFGGGVILLNDTLLNLKFSAYCFFSPIACFLVPFHSDHCIICEPSSNYGCELTPLVSSNFFSPLFQARAFPFINTYKQKYKTVHGDKT